MARSAHTRLVLLTVLLLLCVTDMHGDATVTHLGGDKHTGEMMPALIDELETIFKTSSPDKLDDAFVRLADSLKTIGEQFRMGIKNLENDQNIPKINMDLLKGVEIPNLNDSAGMKTPSTAIASTNKMIMGTQGTLLQGEHFIQAQGSKLANSSAVMGSQGEVEEITDITEGEGKQLLEKLKAISASRASKFRHSREENGLENNRWELLKHEIEASKKSLDPKDTKQAFNETKQAMQSLTSSFDVAMGKFKEKFGQDGGANMTTFTANVTHLIDTLNDDFESKAMNVTFKNMWASLNDIGQQINSNTVRLNKEMKALISANDVSITRINPYQSSREGTGKSEGNKRDDSEDLERIQESMNKINTTFDLNMLLAEFAKIKITMKNIKTEINAVILQLMKVITKDSKGKVISETRHGNKVPSNVENSNVRNNMKALIDDFNPAEIQEAFLDFGHEIKRMGDQFNLGIKKLAKDLNLPKEKIQAIDDESETVQELGMKSREGPMTAKLLAWKQETTDKGHQFAHVSLKDVQTEHITTCFEETEQKLLDLKINFNKAVMSLGDEIDNLMGEKKQIAANEAISSELRSWEEFKAQFSAQHMADTFNHLFRAMTEVQHDIEKKFEGNKRTFFSSSTNMTDKTRKVDLITEGELHKALARFNAAIILNSIDTAFIMLDDKILETQGEVNNGVKYFKGLVTEFKRDSSSKDIKPKVVESNQEERQELPKNATASLTAILKRHNPENLSKSFERIAKEINRFSDLFQSSIQLIKKKLNVSHTEEEENTKDEKGNMSEEKEFASISDAQLPTRTDKALPNSRIVREQAKSIKNDAIDVLKEMLASATQGAIFDRVINKLNLPIDKANGELIVAEGKATVLEENADKVSNKLWIGSEKAVTDAEISDTIAISNKETKQLDQFILQTKEPNKGTSGQLSRYKCQVTSSRIKQKNKFKNILTKFEDIGKHLQPDIMKKSIEDAKIALNELQMTVINALKETVNEINNGVSKHMEVSEEGTQKGNLPVSNDNIRNFMAMLEDRFDQIELTKEFKEMWNEYRNIVNDIEKGVMELGKEFHEMKRDSDAGIKSKLQERKDGVDSELIMILEKIKNAVDPYHINSEFKWLNDSIKQVKDKVDIALIDIKNFITNNQQLSKPVQEISNSIKWKQKEKQPEEVLEKIMTILKPLKPEEMGKEFGNLRTEITKLEKKIDLGIKELKNGEHQTPKPGNKINTKNSLVSIKGKIAEVDKSLADGISNINEMIEGVLEKQIKAAYQLKPVVHNRAARYGGIRLPDAHLEVAEGGVQKSRNLKLKEKIEECIKFISSNNWQKEVEKMQHHLGSIKVATDALVKQQRAKKILKHISGRTIHDSFFDKLKELFHIKGIQTDISQLRNSSASLRRTIASEVQYIINILNMIQSHVDNDEESSSTGKRQMDDNKQIKQGLNRIKAAFKLAELKELLTNFEKDTEAIDETLKTGMKEFLALTIEKTATEKQESNQTDRPQNTEDTLVKLYEDLAAADISKAFEVLGNTILDIESGFNIGFDEAKCVLEQKKGPTKTKLTLKQRELLIGIRRAIKKYTKSQKTPRKTEKEAVVSDKENTLGNLKLKLIDIHNSVKVIDFDRVFLKIFNEIQQLSAQFENALINIESRLDLAGLTSRECRTSNKTTRASFVEKLEQPFDANKINQKFTVAWKALTDAAGKIQTGIAKVMENLDKIQKVKRSTPQASEEKELKVDPKLMKMIDDIKETFDPEKISKTFIGLRQKLDHIGNALNNGLHEFIIQLDKMSREEKSVTNKEVSLPSEHQRTSVDDVILNIETMLNVLKHDDINQVFTNIGSKMKDLRNIFRSSISKLESDIVKSEGETKTLKIEESQIISKIQKIFNVTQSRINTNPRVQIEREEKEPTSFSDILAMFGGIQKELNLENLRGDFAKLVNKVKTIQKKLFLVTKNLLNPQSSSNQKYGSSEKPIAKLPMVFDTERINKAFDEVCDSLIIAEMKLEKAMKRAAQDMASMLVKQEIRIVLEDHMSGSNMDDPAAQKILQEVDKVLAKIKAMFSPKALNNVILKLDKEIIDFEDEVNGGLKKIKTFVLSHMNEDDTLHHLEVYPKDRNHVARSNNRGKQYHVSDVNGDGSIKVVDTDSIAHEIDLDKATEMLNKEEFGKLNSLVELVLDEGQQLVNAMKVFSQKLKLAGPVLPDTATVKPQDPLPTIKPLKVTRIDV